jgi:YggT family protein
VLNTLVGIVAGAIWLETLLILASVLLSWLPIIKPWHPIARGIHALVDPVLRPFQRLVPPIAGFDFSPLLAIIALRLVSGLLTSLTAGGASIQATLLGALAQLVLGVTLLLAVLVGLRLVLSALNVSRWNPIVRFVDRASFPLVRPFARLFGSGSLMTATVVALAGYVGLYILASFAFASLQRLVA